MLEKRSGKIGAAEKAEEAGKRIECGGFCRKCMGLLVRHHLQTVFDTAQKIVSRRQLIACRCVDPAVGRQHGQRGESTAAAQLGVATAGNELLGLGKKLDLADAATAELDVVTFDRDLAMAAIGVDLPLHFVDVGDGGEIEIFPPDERRRDQASSRSPAARSPAQARALISAARSQFCPRLS